LNTFRIIGSTIGEGNAAHVDQWKPYRWNGDPDKAEGAPGVKQEPRGNCIIRAKERAARIEVFTALVLSGIPWREAAKDPAIDVEIKTARKYWNELPADVQARAVAAQAERKVS